MNNVLTLPPQRLSEKLESWIRDKFGMPAINLEERNFYRVCMKSIHALRAYPQRRELTALAYQGWVKSARPSLKVMNQEKFLELQRTSARGKLQPSLINRKEENLLSIKQSALESLTKGVSIEVPVNQTNLSRDIQTFYTQFLSVQFDKGNMVSSDHLTRFLKGKGYVAAQTRPVFTAVSSDELSTDLLIGGKAEQIFIGKSLVNLKAAQEGVTYEVTNKEVFTKFGSDLSKSREPSREDGGFNWFGFLNLGR